jgi:hypothetical protein
VADIPTMSVNVTDTSHDTDVIAPVERVNIEANKKDTNHTPQASKQSLDEPFK